MQNKASTDKPSDLNTAERKAALLERLQVTKAKKHALSVSRAEAATRLYETSQCCSLVEQHLNAHWHAQAKLNDELDSGECSTRYNKLGRCWIGHCEERISTQ